MARTEDPTTRRAVLAALSAVAGAGAGYATASVAGAPAPPPLPAGEAIDIRRFGAVGDGVADDAGAIDRAIAAAGRANDDPTRVLVPAGRYRRSRPVLLPHRLTLEGEGASSILDSQNDPAFTRPILQNAQPYGLTGLRLRNIALHGGSHALYLDANTENADLVLEDVTMRLQSVANIQSNKLFQTATLLGCRLGDARFGLRVDDWAVTAFVSVGTQWTDHTDSSLWIRGVEGMTIVGGRFEGGGARGKISIDVERGASLTFVGVYFENVHETLGRFRAIAGGVVFQNCHFSGTKLGGTTMTPFKWDVDDTVLVFRDCHSSVPMPVDATIRLEGANHNIHPARARIDGAADAGTLTLAAVATTAAAVPVISLTPEAATPDPPPRSPLIGWIDAWAVDAPDAPRQRFEIRVANGTATVRGDPGGAVAITASPSPRGTILLSLAGRPGARVALRFEWRQDLGTPGYAVAGIRR